MEYFKYMVDLLRARGGAHIQVFGGGGGVIVPPEIRELQAYGVARIFSPEDGQRMGLAGMIGEMVMRCDQDLTPHAPTTTGGPAGPRRDGLAGAGAVDHGGGKREGQSGAGPRDTVLGCYNKDTGGGDYRHGWRGQVQPDR